jgi:hypothetical protein
MRAGPAICSAVSMRFWAAVMTAQLRMSSAQPFSMSTCPPADTGGQFQLSICGLPKSPSALTHAPCSTCTTSSAGTGWSARYFWTTVGTKPAEEAADTKLGTASR